MHTLRGIHNAHVTHTQIMWQCLYIIFSGSKFPMQYDGLSQQQQGFLL